MKNASETNHPLEELTFISVENPGTDNLYLQLLDLGGRLNKEIPFDKENNVGSVCNMTLKDMDVKNTGYRLRSGSRVFMDPYCTHVSGDEEWGKYNPVGRFDNAGYEPAEPLKNRQAFSDTLLYHLHVRGFTMGKASNVKYKGTFEGVIEKIPYLKELGINAVELMPSYDFNEIMRDMPLSNQEEAKKGAGIKHRGKKRLNYWGYAEGNYFVPKNSFSAKGDGVSSFKALVSALHKEGIEVIADFYFESSLTSRFIVDVLRYWVVNYAVDGFALFGSEIPAADILRDPYLTDSKFIFEHGLTGDSLRYIDNGRKERIAVLNGDFLYDNRRFLKSDADMLSGFARHLLEEKEYSLINFMSGYNTLTMNDMVSFDRKHNEDNGENNEDGTDNNYSWNCGTEGLSRRKAVKELRDRQVKNAYTYLFLSRGTPRILMGDEFRNSEKGNNNPYCLDNAVTWLNWEDLDKNKETFEFVKKMTALRRENPVFRHPVNGGKKGRYPETSFHGEMAWQAMFYDYFRHIGVLYCDDCLFYCAYNMHWQEQKLALPKLDKGKRWEIVIDTYKGGKKPKTDEGYLYVPPRSVIVLRAD